MELTTKNKREVRANLPWGVYLWRMPDGSFVGDDAGHFLMINAMRGDQEKMQTLKDTARTIGVTEGGPCFFPGRRVVSDEEYEEQLQRMKFGLVPDPLDYAAVKDEERARRNRR